ncbi:MAG: hypothetical protein J3K34DRAFT_472897 [Monoraphidium minutum]|nr:MAG: hypothetical protein J3K34DRAFT_472897 [Monoraphidium minutum]
MADPCGAPGADAVPGADADAPCCWICLGSDGPLERPCACPRDAHARCLARWQLQQAGRAEERACRFCGAAYGDWREQLAAGAGLAPATPVMAVSVGGCVHKLRVRPGPEGKAVRQLLGYDEAAEFDVVFECKVPNSGEKVHLSGFQAFDAATHCALVSAARRLARRREQQQAQQQQQQAQQQQQQQQQQAQPGAVGTMSLRPPPRHPSPRRGAGAGCVTGGPPAAAAPPALPPPPLRSDSSVSVDAAIFGAAPAATSGGGAGGGGASASRPAPASAAAAGACAGRAGGAGLGLGGGAGAGSAAARVARKFL